MRLDDVARLGPALDALVTAGANQMNGIDFAIKDPAPLLAEARADAVGQILEQITGRPNREVRRTLRPNPTANIPATVVQAGDNRLILMDVDDDQYTMFVRFMHGRVDTQVVVADQPRGRRELGNIEPVRKLRDILQEGQ